MSKSTFKSISLTLAVFTLAVLMHQNSNILSNNSSNIAAISGAGSGLVANYTFDEGTAEGKVGKAKVFTTTDTVSAGDTGDVGTGNFSISIWLKTSSTASRQIPLVKLDGTGYFLDILSGEIPRLYLVGAQSLAPQFSVSNFADGNWKHLVFVVDRSVPTGISMYVNGTKITCDGNCGYDLATVGNLDNAGSLVLGSTKAGASWEGTMDDLRIYGRVLTVPEIQELYNFTGSTSVVPPTSVPGDVTSPVISLLTKSNIGAGSATITWNTNESSDTQIEYGLTNTYGNTTTLNSTFGTSHSEVISNLQPATTYYFKVKSKDSSGNIGIATGTFVTLQNSSGDLTPPILTNGAPSTALVSGTKTATLSLQTNEKATCRYSLSANIAYASMTSSLTVDTSGLNHSANITGLTDGTTTSYYVRCADILLNTNTNDYLVKVIVSTPQIIQVLPTVDDDSVTILAGALNLGGQGSGASWWNPYTGLDAPEGAFMGWINYGGTSGDTSLSGRITLPKSLAPGRYYVFVKGIAYYSNMKMDVSLGGSASTVSFDNHDYNKYWSTRGTVDITSSSNTLSILLKPGISGAEQKLLLRGVYITKNPNDIVFKDDTVMELAYPTVMDESPAVKGNVLENSDFEVGSGHGWNMDYFRGIPLVALWDTTVSKYGKASFKLPLTGLSSVYGDSRKPGAKQLFSRFYTLKPNKKYTLSAWVKTDVPSSTRIGGVLRLDNAFGMDGGVFPIPPGYPAQHTIAAGFIATPDWQRISVTGYSLKYPTSDYQVVLWLNTHESINGSVWVDGIQLEEGDLTDYKQSNPIEIGLVTNRPGNIYFEDESKNATLLAYNSTTEAVTKEIKYEIFDYLNRKVKNGSQNVTVAPNTTQNTSLNLDTGDLGIFRIVFWINGEDGTEEELSYSVVPRPHTMGLDESSVMGIHPNNLDFQLEELQRLGIKWGRALSPGALFRWTIIEPVDDQFIWYDELIQRSARHGITTLGTLSTNDFWPAWAADPATGFMKLDEWEEFVGQVVAHYKPWVKYWEIWNEPNYTFTHAFYAQMMKRAADAIERNDPDAKIVGMGGSYDEKFFAGVVAEMERQFPNWNCSAPDPSNPDCSWEGHFVALATHLYPIEQKFDGVERFSQFKKYTENYGTEIWNTETGAWDHGFAKGPNSHFITFGKNLWGSSEADRYYRGSLLAAELTVQNFLHSIGNGETKFFYYDSRIFANSSYNQHHPTILEYDDTIRAKGIAYSIAGSFVDHATALDAVNLNPNVFAYLFDKDGVPTLAIWTKDLSNKSLNLPIPSSNLRVYDMMGNSISVGSTIPFGRTPIYIKGNGISVSAFQTALASASVSSRSDNTAPSISISDAPRGTIAENSVRVRWISIDETSVPSPDLVDLSIPGSDPVPPAANSSALTYSYRLVGASDSWSNWSPKTLVDYTLPDGSYTFEVKAKDQAGNISSVASRAININNGASPVPPPPTDPTPEDPTPTSLTPDTTPPTISITSPTGTVSGASVSLVASVSDPTVTNQTTSGIASVQFKVNGTNLNPLLTSTPYSGTWDTTAMTNGTYTLTAEASDVAGNKTTSAGRTVTVSNSLPPTVVNLPPVSNAGSDQTVVLGTTVTTTLTGAGSYDPDEDTLTYLWTTTGGTLTNPTSVSPTISFTVTGTYTLTLTVSDGSLTSSDTMTVTVLPKAVVTQIDTDGDTIPDPIDKCPSTPTGRTVNSLGCPLPKITEFPNTTNLTNIDLNKVTSFELANTYGRISYQETNTPYVLVRNSDRLDIDIAVSITQGKVTLDGALLPELNRPATITLYNMKLTKPGIKRNGAPCAGCSEIVYNPSLKTITFKVPGFSTYEIFDDEEEVFDVPVEIIAPTPTSKVGSTGGSSRRISKTGTLTPSPRTTTPQGNTTRAKASEIFALLTFLNIKLTPTQTAAIIQAFPETVSASPSTTSLSCTVLTREMWLGHTDATTGGQVSKLQLFLIAKGYLPVGTPLGYYGALTTSAVTKFQLEKGIVSGGTLSTTGIGGVGVRTMGVVKSGSCY